MSKKSKQKSERKFTSVTLEVYGKKYKKTISYRTVSELAEKREKFKAEILKLNSRKFSDVAIEWQEEHNGSIELYTQKCYATPVKDLIEEFGSYEMGEITSQMFQIFMDRMAKRGYAKQTINLRKIVMKQIFDYAIFHQMVNHNPIVVCKTPKKAAKTTRELPDDADIKKIKADSEDMFGLYCNLLLYTGLRREEALALKYEDIDFTKNTINISRVLIYDGNIPMIRESTKSESGIRLIPLLDPLKALLVEKGLNNNSGFVFNEHGKPMKKGFFDKGFNAYKKRNGLTLTSHQLRHYFATLCFDANLDEKDTQDIMGHSKITLTRDIYTHIRKQRKQETAYKLNDFLLTLPE